MFAFRRERFGVTVLLQIPKTKGSHSTPHNRGSITDIVAEAVMPPTSRRQFVRLFSLLCSSSKCPLLSRCNLTSCCRLQLRAPVRFRTDWHRSRAPAPTLWWRRPSSAPRPSGRAPCPRLLLGGPPVCLQVREGPLARKWAVWLRRDTARRRRRWRRKEGRGAGGSLLAC